MVAAKNSGYCCANSTHNDRIRMSECKRNQRPKRRADVQQNEPINQLHMFAVVKIAYAVESTG